jgi:flagellar hook-length control protein FliK
MLKEERVRPVTNDWDFAGSIAGASKQNKNATTAGLFEALFAQLSQNNLAEPFAATSPQPAAVHKVQPAESRPAAVNQETPLRPIQRLKASLEETGQPLERFEVAAEDRDALKECLVKSGYSETDAQEIIERASQDDGTVNMGAFFAVMEQYQPSEGPVFLISAEDKPLLMQVLKDLGIPDNEVRQYLDGLAKQGDMLVVSGLPKMVMRALELQEVRDGSTEIDQDTLRDLLTRIGLSSQDINTLLTKASDSQGRIAPQALLQVFEQAASRQDTQIKNSLQNLAQKLRVTDGEQKQAPDAERIKAQVMEILQKVEIQAKPQEKSEFAQAIKETLQANGKEEAKPEQEEVIRLVREQVATAQAKTSSGGGQGGESKADSQGQAWAGMAGAKQQAAAPAAKGTAQSDASFQATLAAAGNDGHLAGASKAMAARGGLPAYVVRQVSDQIALMARNNQSQLRLALKPPELGELTIKLSLREGVLKATLVADSASAKQTLEAGLNELKQQLAQQGLKLERMEVVVSPDAERREARGGEQGSGGKREKGSKGNSAQVEMNDDEIAPAALGMDSASGRVNVFA